MKIFISYSWTPEENKKITVKFAKKLSEYGFEVILDQTHLKFGYDKYAFMEKIVTDSTVDKVFIICNKDYAEKADGRIGGVGDESMIITPEMYGKTEQSKFIPIVFEKDSQGKAYLPCYLKRIMYVDLSDEKTRKYTLLDLLKQIREPYFSKICDCFQKSNIKYKVYFNELRVAFSLEFPLGDGFTLIALDDGRVLSCISLLSEIPKSDIEHIKIENYNTFYGDFIFEEDTDDENMVNLIFANFFDEIDSNTIESEISDFLEWLKQSFNEIAMNLLKDILENNQS